MLTVVCFIICLTCQMMLRSQKFADKFQSRDDKKIDWRQFWIKQLLTIFNAVQISIASLLVVAYNGTTVAPTLADLDEPKNIPIMLC